MVSEGDFAALVVRQIIVCSTNPDPYPSVNMLSPKLSFRFAVMFQFSFCVSAKLIQSNFPIGIFSTFCAVDHSLTICRVV